MKKFYYIIFLLLPALCFVGCSDEGMFSSDDEEYATLRYTVSMNQDIQSRAIGDGNQVDHLKVLIFQDDNLVKSESFERNKETGTFSVELTLLNTPTYKLVFWADKKDNGIYAIDENGNLTIDYSKYTNLSLTGTEAFEAFYAWKEVCIKNGQNVSGNISLTRPFSQLNIAAKEEDVFNKAKTASLTIDQLYTSFSLLDGSHTGEASEATLSFQYSEGDLANKQSIQIGDDNYYYVASAYLLAPEKVNITGGLYGESNTTLKEFDFKQVSLVTNHRTNIYGEMIQVEELAAWDGVIPSVSPLTQDAENRYIIDEEADLAWLSVAANTATLSENSTFIVTKNVLNMGSKEISSIHLPKGSTFNGSNKTIQNFANSLFGEATNLTVKNLIVENVTATAEAHVGVLVNTLKGNSSFEGITINNSSATTTNGAAGGMIGYIVRASEKDRSETLSVSFSECHVNNTTISSNDAEGKFVGLLSGYDNGETLSFDAACSVQDNTTDYTSLYTTDNQSIWAEEITEDYDGWLGNETYHRGIVKFDSKCLVPKWDGTTTVEPLLANATYDSEVTAGSNRYVVYSPFDLAGVRKEKGSPAAIYLRADIDMNGQGADGKFNVPSNFTQSAYTSTDDNNFTPFDYVTTLDGKKSDAENYSIYNLAISQIEQERAAFILYASGTTVHQNINFRNCQTVAVHKDVTTDAKAYGAILVSNVEATYTMKNVHAYDCKVFALQKIGTLGARISGTSTLTNNSVNNCYIENYECNINERFQSGSKTIAGFTIDNVYADFYPHGEVGGMYGFIQDNSTVGNCEVNGTTINAYGQDDKEAEIKASGWKGALAVLGVKGLGYYLVPGRHVSTMIGNIRATGTITLTSCTVDADSECTNRWDMHNTTYNYIGQAYIVKFLDNEGSVTVDGKKLTLADCNKNTKL